MAHDAYVVVTESEWDNRASFLPALLTPMVRLASASDLANSLARNRQVPLLILKLVAVARHVPTTSVVVEPVVVEPEPETPTAKHA